MWRPCEAYEHSDRLILQEELSKITVKFRTIGISANLVGKSVLRCRFHLTWFSICGILLPQTASTVPDENNPH